MSSGEQDAISLDDIKFDSYSLEESPSSSRKNSSPVEYVLHEPSESDKQEYSSSKSHVSRPSKPVIQDIYDEGHYCLARTSGISPHDREILHETDRLKDGDTKPTFCSRNKKIIGSIIAVLIIGSIGGVVAFVFSNNQGTI